MKLTVKTLKGQMINVQVDDQGTIQDIKQKVKGEKGIEVQAQKIIFKGKTTTNTEKLQDIGIKQNDFLVLMTVIKKPEKKEEPKVEPKQQKPTDTKTEQKKDIQPEVKTQKKSEAKQQNASGQGTPQFQAKINELMSMGFDREKCVAALKAAFGDADRAVQYIFNGIPQNPLPPEGAEGQVTDDKVENLFRMLLSNPSFAQLKQVIKNDPNTLQPILAQLSQSSPELYALISQHPEAFQRVIMEQGGQGTAPPRPPAGSIQVSPEQAASIERLMSFGFTKIDAAQAYFACDKNQELAANLLFDRQANGDLEPLQDPNEPGQGGNNDDDDDNLFN